MGRINMGRWLAGGLVAAVVLFIVEGIASVFHMEDMEAAPETLGIAMAMSGANWFLAVLAGAGSTGKGRGLAAPGGLVRILLPLTPRKRRESPADPT